MTTPLRFAVLAALALVFAGSARAGSIEDLQAAKAKLEQELAREQREKERFRERRTEKQAQLEANERTPEVRDKLAKEAEKAATNAMKDAAKDIPNALGGNDAKMAPGIIKDLFNMRDAERNFNGVNTPMGDGTIDRERDALQQGIKDLINKEAIYGAYISGLNTAIANLDAAITKESAAQWAAFLGNLSKAVTDAQQRVNDRHAAEAKAAADKAAEKAKTEHEPHGGDRPDPSKPPDTKPPDKPKVDKPQVDKPGPSVEIGPKS